MKPDRDYYAYGYFDPRSYRSGARGRLLDA